MTFTVSSFMIALRIHGIFSAFERKDATAIDSIASTNSESVFIPTEYLASLGMSLEISNQILYATIVFSCTGKNRGGGGII